MSTSILDVIGHYQRSIERAQKQHNPLAEGKSAKFLHCIEKLNKLTVKVEHLQATGIGKTVNSLRKYEGEVGIAAKALVAKWKAVVTAEEYANEQSSRRGGGGGANNNDGGRGGAAGGSSGRDANGNLPTSSNPNNGYINERDSTQTYSNNLNSDRQQMTKQNLAETVYYQNSKIDSNNKQSNIYDIQTKMLAPNARPPAPMIDPNVVHTIDDEDDDDNDVQLIIDENNLVKASSHLNSNAVANLKSDKYGNAVNESPKTHDETYKKDKHPKHHSSEKKHGSEHRRNNASHTSSHSRSSESSRGFNQRPPEDMMLNSHEPPSAAEVCQEDMHSDRVSYDNLTGDIANDKGNASSQNEEHKNSKHHKSSHNEVEHSSKKKKNKKHKEKKSKSKHHDNNDSSNKLSESKHEKKHKDKSREKSSKDKKSKETSEEEADKAAYNKMLEDNENGKINMQQSSNKEINDQKIRLSDEFMNEVSSSTTTPSKTKKSKNETKINNGIDSTTGASFEQALGMITMPKKSKTQNKNEPPGAGGVPDPSVIMPKKRLSRDEPSGSGIISKKPKLSAPQVMSNSDSESDAGSDDDNHTKTPSLLSSSANLQPLDPSIALELPTISNNYKPMPLNQTVMDCVFPQAKPQKMFTDEEALAHGISSKTIRTKVYSGAKTGQKVQVPTLFNLCIRCLQKNIDALEYTGGVPFDILKPVLEMASPEQLAQFEEYNPYLMEDTDILWEQHVKRRFRAYKREELESYREMFIRCKEKQDAHLNRLTENIKQSQIQTSLPVRKTQLAYVDSMVKPPRYVKKKQERFGTNEKLVATPAARVAALQAITPNATKSGDVRLRVAAGTRDTAQVTVPKGRKAPLMAKTLQFMRGRIRR